jgi:hypothetical protein
MISPNQIKVNVFHKNNEICLETLSYNSGHQSAQYIDNLPLPHTLKRTLKGGLDLDIKVFSSSLLECKRSKVRKSLYNVPSNFCILSPRRSNPCCQNSSFEMSIPDSFSKSSGFLDPPEDRILKYFGINDNPSVLNCWYKESTSKFPKEYA